MANNPHRPGASASTSFRAREIEWLDQLFSTLRRGGDPVDLMRVAQAMTVGQKVESMKRSLARQAIPNPDPEPPPVHHCGRCGGIGHNARTCRNRPA
jgi:hypothetical protein